MDAFQIHGGRPLRGTVTINGSKNAALPLMAATLLTDEPVALHNVPNLRDTRNMLALLQTLGMAIDTDDTQHQHTFTPTDPTQTTAHYDIVRTMRAGICVLGPLLAKRGHAKVSMPGGCAIGTRPVDLHLRGLKALGADITLEAGYIVAQAPRDSHGNQRLVGRHVFLGGPNGSTVLGTANVLSAAVLAQGTTVLESAACEPEIKDLGRLLISMGAHIQGLGSPTLTIEGVESLHAPKRPHAVIPDRIEAGTYVVAAAITAGDVTLQDYPLHMLGAFHDRLEQVGVRVEPVEGTGIGDRGSGQDKTKPATNPNPIPGPRSPIPHADRCTIRVLAPRRLDPVHAVTQPHPGFPTDLQAQLMALLTLADGNSTITEKIFPDRFLHVPELQRMGSDITRMGPHALVRGVRQLTGAPVMASDLRASAGLVLAGLAATGTTTVQRVYHLDRGYEHMETTLQQLGADIERIDADAA